jgi:Zn-dependent peptidase ImmA (M78 family)
VLFRGTVSDWKEVQANKGMAALLMPKSIFAELARRELKVFGDTRVLRGSAEATTLAGRLAAYCKVSRQASLIRLETLNLLSEKDQVELF